MQRLSLTKGSTTNKINDLVGLLATLAAVVSGSFPSCIPLEFTSLCGRWEYPAVVIPVMTQHYAMLQRNLLYTGVIRGKRLVVLVGQKKAVAIAVRNVSDRRRWSKLQEWLRPSPSLSRPIGMAC
jgi:hypothetical protein